MSVSSPVRFTDEEGKWVGNRTQLETDVGLVSSINPLPVAGIAAIEAAVEAADYITTYIENSGSNDMGVKGDVTPVSFIYTPPAGKNFLAARVLVYMESGTNFDSTKFMNLAALTNGVKISAAGVELTNWQDNIDIIEDMFDLSSAGKAFSTEAKSLAGRWSFTRATGEEPIKILNGETFEVLIRDDLSAAGIIFRIKIQGKLEDL